MPPDLKPTDPTLLNAPPSPAEAPTRIAAHTADIADLSRSASLPFDSLPPMASESPTGITVRRVRTNATLPHETQTLDHRLQTSRASVLADIDRREAGRLPPGIRRLITEHGSEGRYAIEAHLAQGGMGAVMRIRDGDFQRPAAMKVVLPRHKAHPGHLERFLQEAQITAQLEHPNIVPIHDLGIMADGTVYFTMMYIAGESLGAVLRRRRSPDAAERATAQAQWTHDRLIAALLKALDGVGYAHSRGVIHRDLKPDNIMLGEHGEVLVVDWGIAKVLGSAEPEHASDVVHLRSDEALSHTVEGRAMGSPHYMPPEQARGELERIGIPADIYALGATLYEILTGSRPVHGATSNEVIAKVAAGQTVPITVADPTLPPDLAAIVSQAMHADPQLRYPSCDAFANDLRRYLAGMAVQARRRNLIERIGAWVGRHRQQVAWTAAALAATAAIGGIAYGQGLASERRRIATQLVEARSAAARDDWEQVKNLAFAITQVRPGGEAEDLKQRAIAQLAVAQQTRTTDEAQRATRIKAIATASTALAQAREAHQRMQEARAEQRQLESSIAALSRQLADQPLESKEALLKARSDALAAATTAAEQWALTEGAARTAMDAMGGITTPATAEARALLVALYRERRAHALASGNLADVAAFANLLQRLGESIGDNQPGRLVPEGPPDLVCTIHAVHDNGSGRFLVASEPLASTRCGNPLSLPAGRYAVRWGSDDLACVLVGSDDLHLALPGEPTPQLGFDLRLRWLPDRNGLWMSEHEVTVAQYAAFLADPEIRRQVLRAHEQAQRTGGNRPLRLLPRVSQAQSLWPVGTDDVKPLPGTPPTSPVFCVSREDAEAYCLWLSERTGRGVRLPTQAEFRFAVSGGDPLRLHPWGPIFDYAYATTAMPRRPAPPPVGTTPADRGPFGHVDLAGSVREWTADPGLAFNASVVGGAYTDDNPLMFLGSANEGLPANAVSSAIGFRIVVEALAVP